MPGSPTIDREIATGAAKDRWSEVRVDLAAAFPNGLGHAVVRLEPLPLLKQPAPSPVSVVWVQSTQLGLDAIIDRDYLVAWANHLASGRPLAGVQVQLLPQGKPQVTREDGLATLMTRDIPGSGKALLVARKGDDSAFIPQDPKSKWKNDAGRPDRPLWYVAEDRPLHRAGEKVSLKGWLRKATYGPQGDIRLPSAKTIRYSVQDAQARQILKGQAALGRLGGFAMTFRLPNSLPAGNCSLNLKASRGVTTTHNLRIGEYRPPQFQVVSWPDSSSVLLGAHDDVTVAASHLSGAPLCDAEVDWKVTTSPTTYSPPHWPDYRFGPWTPGDDRAEDAPVTGKNLKTRTDGRGLSRMRLSFRSAGKGGFPQPTEVKIEATVPAGQPQAQRCRTTILVHASSLYVGLKSPRTLLHKGETCELNVIVTDVEGKAVAGKSVELKVRGENQDESTQQLISQEQPVAVKIGTREGGVYIIEASIQDAENRRSQSETRVTVRGGLPPASSSGVAEEHVLLVSDKSRYRGDETAEILAQAPFAPAELWVTTRRNGLAEVSRLSAPDGSATLRIPIKEIYAPVVAVQVYAVGARTGHPAYAEGGLELEISKASRQLQLALEAARSAATLTLKDGQNRPVRGEIALWAVGDASGYDPADPLETFCPVRSPDVIDLHSRLSLVRDRPTAESWLRGAWSRLAQSEGRVFAVPANLAPPVLFLPTVVTDEQGQARVPLNLTGYRLIALAAAGDKQFGKSALPRGGGSLVTPPPPVAPRRGAECENPWGAPAPLPRGGGSPLSLRTSTPRWLSAGDRFEMPTVLENGTDQSMLVSLVCRGSNVNVGKGASVGFRLDVPARSQVEVRIPCSAAEGPPSPREARRSIAGGGTARLQLAASFGDAFASSEVSLPVCLPEAQELEGAREPAAAFLYRMSHLGRPGLQLEPTDHGLALQRRYQAVHDNRDVSRDAEGNWHVRAGAEVKVSLTLRVHPGKGHPQVALVDHLPAGLDVENPALPGQSPWFLQKNGRIGAFTAFLNEGVYLYTYTARAVIPGTYLAAPAQVGEVNQPEIRGTSHGDTVVVEDAPAVVGSP